MKEKRNQEQERGVRGRRQKQWDQNVFVKWRRKTEKDSELEGEAEWRMKCQTSGTLPLFFLLKGKNWCMYWYDVWCVVLAAGVVKCEQRSLLISAFLYCGCDVEAVRWCRLKQRSPWQCDTVVNLNGRTLREKWSRCHSVQGKNKMIV